MPDVDIDLLSEQWGVKNADRRQAESDFIDSFRTPVHTAIELSAKIPSDERPQILNKAPNGPLRPPRSTR